MKIAFDVDDTLIIPRIVTGGPVDSPNYETISIYRWFQSHGHHMIIWSGGGPDYARMWAEKLGLFPDEIRVKEKSSDIDVCFDDCIIDLAHTNIRVKRVKNGIDRRKWNMHEEERGL